MSAPACSVASLAVNEPLAGTAIESVDRWLLLEVTDTWAPKVLQTEAFSDAVRERLTDWSDTPGSRLQLIRRPGRTGKRPLLMVVSSAGTASRVELDRHEDILDLDLEALPTGRAAPTYLVCVHGRRDRCCAQHGSAAYRALKSAGVEVWQTSHLGGHRFAACVLFLPEGLMYGRLRAEHASELVTANRSGQVGDLELLRGRCEHDRPTQAAEIFLRRRDGQRAIDAYEWLETEADGGGAWTARFRSASSIQTVRVVLEETSAARPASCGGEPEPVSRFVDGDA